MQIEFLYPGKTKEDYCVKGISFFLKRLQHFVKADIKIVKEKKTDPGKDKNKYVEATKKVLEQADSKTFLVMLDSTGNQLGSKAFADLLTNWEETGRRHITFFVGSAQGIPQELLQDSDYTLSLSKMTFPHDLARLVLLEQVYRAFTIKAGSGYHK